MHASGFGNALLIAPLNSVPFSGSQQLIGEWFNINAFDRKSADQVANNIQTLSTRFSGVLGPGVDVWNMSAVKNFPINETLRLQFRAELLNALNHTSLSAPNTVLTNASFGIITAANSQPRFIHLALKLAF
jgi:hypothetical protein